MINANFFFYSEVEKYIFISFEDIYIMYVDIHMYIRFTFIHFKQFIFTKKNFLKKKGTLHHSFVCLYVRLTVYAFRLYQNY